MKPFPSLSCGTLTEPACEIGSDSMGILRIPGDAAMSLRNPWASGSGFLGL